MARQTGKAGHILVILVDTNVLSAVMRAANEPAVERWFDAQPPEVNLDDDYHNRRNSFGLALLAPRRRRDWLYTAFNSTIDDILGGRVLPFDRNAGNRGRDRRDATANWPAGGDPRRPDRRYRRRAQSNPRNPQHPSF
jgi:predicted nucleic acid-binding protein